MKTLWVLIANASFAQIYQVKGHGREIQRIEQIDHPDGRKKNSEILTDKPGRTNDSLGSNKHSYETHVDPKTHGLQQFVHHILEYVKKAKDHNLFDELAIIAPPNMLGEFNHFLADPLKKILVKSIGKDLPIAIHEDERIELICNYLDLFNHK